MAHCENQDCANGWVPVIEVYHRGKVVDVRPYGMVHVADPELYTQAWYAADGQQVYEAAKPCPACNPHWVPPELRKDLEEYRKEGASRARNRVDDLEDDPVAVAKRALGK